MKIDWIQHLHTFTMKVGLLFWVILSLKARTAYTAWNGYDFIFDSDSSSEENLGNDLRIADSCTWQRRSIECDASKGWPTFQKDLLDTKYATPGRVDISIIGDVSMIPAQALAPFKLIKHLSLKNMKIGSVQPLKWDKDAFTGITVYELAMKNVVGVFPLPDALHPLGYNLRKLSIEGAGNGVYLKRNDFYWFPRLEKLEIRNTQISWIENTTFSGMTNLCGLELSLTVLSFSFLEMLIPFIDFLPLRMRSQLADLSGLSELPNRVKTLSLDDNNLTSIPTKLIIHSPKLRYLYLQRNKISLLSFADLPSNLFWLDVGGNPITAIDFSFKPRMVEFLDLSNTKLSNVDLTDFVDTKLSSLYLEEIPSIKQVTMSGKPPKKLHRINLKGSGLETIHPNVEELFYHSDKFEIDIRNCMNLICNYAMAWMVRAAVCHYRYDLLIEGAKCANLKKSLTKYLDELVPDPCSQPMKFRYHSG